CQGKKWKALCEDAANHYRSKLVQRDRELFREWNLLVRELKNLTMPLVLRKTRNVVDHNNLPQGIVDAVQWDVLHLGMEAEYADVLPPGFYAAQAYWYMKGHFPCGWDGDFPSGRPIVF
ncbi:hypothetical protein P0D72_38575, partial [Paraburkholderia sediminicola]